MLLVTTVCFALAFTTRVYADPQPQPQPPPGSPGSRPAYPQAAGPLAPRPQYQQGPGFSPVGPPQAQYQRPPNNYVINSTPKPISIHNLPSPSPVQSPISASQLSHRQQQLTGPPRQQQPVPSSSIAAGRYPGPEGQSQSQAGYAQSLAANRNRYQPSPQQQSKYSSQLKLNGPGAQGAKQNQLTSEEQAEYDEEVEQEPDRLTLLLQESKFTCSGKKDGYYADEGLQCEVFHYCQDGGKHSWMCPNNFAFHQVHLICVPPSSDNICKQSASYHFVNEYLYRPINEKEAQATNSSLKYADRYYPDGYTPGTPLDEMLANYDSSQAQQHEPRAPHAYKSHPNLGNRQQQQQYQQGGGGGDRNVFYSPESINIPLSQRRPNSPIARGSGHVSSQAKPPSPQQQQASKQKYAEEEYDEDEY